MASLPADRRRPHGRGIRVLARDPVARRVLLDSSAMSALPDPTECAVASVVLPSNSPWTARYAAFVPGAHQPVRCSEGYVVIARRPGGPFRPVLTIPCRFDERCLELQDDPERPEHLVIHQPWALRWTTDGGRSFRRLSEELEDIFRVHSRPRERYIESVRLTDADIFARVDCCRLSQLVDGRPPPGLAQVWRIPLAGGAPEQVDEMPPPRPYAFDRYQTVLMEGSRTMPWALLYGRGPPWESEAFLERWTRDGGRFLLERDRSIGPFTPVPLIALAHRLGDCPSC
jgi:hypothetical protein